MERIRTNIFNVLESFGHAYVADHHKHSVNSAVVLSPIDEAMAMPE